MEFCQQLTPLSSSNELSLLRLQQGEDDPCLSFSAQADSVTATVSQCYSYLSQNKGKSNLSELIKTVQQIQSLVLMLQKASRHQKRKFDKLAEETRLFNDIVREAEPQVGDRID